MSEHDWRDLLDDPEVKEIVERVRRGPGLRLYRHDDLEFDDLESWLYDEAVNVAIRYTRRDFGDRLYDARRHFHAWLYVSLRDSIHQGRHLNAFKGKPESTKRQLAYATTSIEQATEEFGDWLETRTHTASERTWASDPLAILMTRDRLTRLLARAQTMPRRPYVVESNGLCIVNLCCKPVFTQASGLCTAHYQQQRKYNSECSIPDCHQGGAHSKGLCATHWRQARLADPDAPRCTEPDCDSPTYARSLCRAHYKQAQRRLADRWAAERTTRPTICTIPGCDRRVKAKSLCETHYSREKRARKRRAP